MLETSSLSSLFEGASAPPYELMNNGSIHKKQGSGKNGNNSVSGLLDQQPPQHLSDSNGLLTSEQEIKDAFLQYAATKFCYRTAPAKHLKVQKLTPLNTFRYRLETFTESRDTHLASECYYGGFVDSADVASPPTPWEISVDPPPLFTDCEMHIPMPHSYSLGNCQNCRGHGATTCQSCKGKGTKKCSACNQTGFNSSDYSSCSWCSGTGNKRCFSCRGNGRHMCYRCDWKGILLYHTELSITWKNNILEYTADNKSELPVHHLQEVTGRKILSDEYNLVHPIIEFPESSIKDYSRTSIAQHKMMFATGEHRILKQRQTVELVPLTKVKYEWKGKLYSFYVFGNENKVYSKDYPAKCYCSIL
ncbi:protein SSUH2 homolog isoform X2 [Notechis scutatus]|uniref:Protein SSUH2 homolog isoform X2 n=1 Tax=Notechis scutatus TaxID=8663 RepID=A0A6J1V437_9SAUR|nr:protein SSUH2 homolog isoform X2 [Notechis scutatus]